MVVSNPRSKNKTRTKSNPNTRSKSKTRTKNGFNKYKPVIGKKGKEKQLFKKNTSGYVKIKTNNVKHSNIALKLKRNPDETNESYENKKQDIIEELKLQKMFYNSGHLAPNTDTKLIKTDRSIDIEKIKPINNDIVYHKDNVYIFMEQVQSVDEFVSKLIRRDRDNNTNVELIEFINKLMISCMKFVHLYYVHLDIKSDNMGIRLLDNGNYEIVFLDFDPYFVRKLNVMNNNNHDRKLGAIIGSWLFMLLTLVTSKAGIYSDLENENDYKMATSLSLRYILSNYKNWLIKFGISKKVNSNVIMNSFRDVQYYFLQDNIREDKNTDEMIHNEVGYLFVYYNLDTKDRNIIEEFETNINRRYGVDNYKMVEIELKHTPSGYKPNVRKWFMDNGSIYRNRFLSRSSKNYYFPMNDFVEFLIDRSINNIMDL